MKKFLRLLRNFVDISTTTKKYSVSFGDWSGGQFKTFWRYSTAKEFYNKMCESGYMYVSMNDDTVNSSKSLHHYSDKKQTKKMVMVMDYDAEENNIGYHMEMRCE